MSSEPITTGAQHAASPTDCIHGLQRAINQHDLDALTACFAPDYQSEFPAHLARAFRGHDQMRANWTQIFGGVPDIQANLIRCAEDGDTVWSEWEWRGTRVDGPPFWQRGVTIQGVREGRIVWARLYMEPVQSTETGAAVPPHLIGKSTDEATSSATNSRVGEP